ncbi:hypothetical protein K432DRAFT_410394 [Lepidopterella palustris CBS 459.81]|uniref:Cytochrome P450 n=1 Tax=Lepidopterella palustris CBS 459.81 TaxID=1314670 RepID=A0A8E2DXX4_9PEZI|nr:hypothetical protein K432DRAFT_410394 [Lepidopterella palustris CBS 459.81]
MFAFQSKASQHKRLPYIFKGAIMDLIASRVDLLDPVHFITQFPWMIKSLKLLSDWLIEILSTPIRSVIVFNQQMEAQILRAKALHVSGEKNTAAAQSLFTALLESDLPSTELSTKRLQHEAISVISAGIETTMYTLFTCSYHLLANPNIRTS